MNRPDAGRFRRSPRALSAALFLALAACDPSLVDSTGPATLTLDVRLTPAAAAASVDQYRLRIEGPTSRTLTVSPGETRTIEGLLPGGYTVSLEGLTANEVETFGERTNVAVVAGANTPVSVTVGSFVSQGLAIPFQPDEGEPFNVGISPVPGAASYVVEWWFAGAPGSVQSTETSSGSVAIVPDEGGIWYVRVRAKTRFGSLGRPSEVGAVEVLDGPAELIHRWTFSESGTSGTTLVDDVGGADGTIVEVGGLNAFVQNGRVTMAGGDRAEADYVELPGRLLSSLIDVSIEVWATPRGTWNWARIFDIGASTGEYLMMSWSQGLDRSSERVQWFSSQGSAVGTVDDAVGPYALGAPVHLVLTIDGDGRGNGTLIRLFRDGEFKAAFEGPPSLSSLDDARTWLGRSQYDADQTADAVYDEVRIWDGALTDDEVLAHFQQGPADDASTPPVPPAFGFYPTGVDDLGALLGPAARDRHYTLVDWPTTVVPDLITVPMDGATPGEDDPNDYPQGSWRPATATARWIGPDNDDEDQDAFGPAGVVGYRTIVHVPVFQDPASVRIEGVWETDNDGVRIELNGVPVPQAALPQLGVPQPFVLQGGFVWGQNALTFYAYNGGGPMGLRVDDVEVTWESGGSASGVFVTPHRLQLFPGMGVSVSPAAANLPSGNGIVSWASTDESVATVDNGFVTAVGPGSAMITATVNGITGAAEIYVSGSTLATMAHGGHHYVLTTPMSWPAAQALARSHGGHLVTIQDAAENDALLTLTATAVSTFNDDRTWIGLNDRDEEGTFVWTDDVPVDFTAWLDGEPNQAGNEDCAVHGNGPVWVDVPCELQYPAIVEFDFGTTFPVSDFAYTSDRRYARTSTGLTWVQARNMAEALGGTLVAIDTQAEWNGLAIYPLDQLDFWIGLDDRAEEGRFLDPFGESPRYTAWTPGGPDNANNEDCTALWKDNGGLYNDAPCHLGLNAIFEFRAWFKTFGLTPLPTGGPGGGSPRP